MTAPFKSGNRGEDPYEGVNVVNISDFQNWSGYIFSAGGFILTLYSLLDRRVHAPVISRAQLEDWIKRRSQTDFDPYPEPKGDWNGNHRNEVRLRFQGLSIGLWTFFIGFAVWFTTVLIIFSYTGPLPTQYVTGVTQFGSIAALAALVGGILAFVCGRSLSNSKRRHIMALIALAMGYERKDPKKVLVEFERTDPELAAFAEKIKPKASNKSGRARTTHQSKKEPRPYRRP